MTTLVTSLLAMAVAVTVAQSVPPEWNAAFGVLETALGRLGSAAETRYAAVECPSASVCGSASAATCTLPACGESFPSTRGFQCLAAFGNSSALCGCAQGLRRSTSESTVIVPPDTDFADPASQRFVCATKGMDTAFRSEFTSGTLKGFQYTADLKGIARVFPGMAQQRNSGVCDTFDVRRRPWYASALSGPKSVVFVIDSSGSMSTTDGPGGTRMQLVQNAMRHLLGTLTVRDQFDVVDFDSTARSLGGGLRAATRERVRTLETAVNNVVASGGTNFAPALQTAFDLLRDATTDETCRNIIVFLTDGQNQDDETAAVRAGQASLPEGKKAHMMTFSMSNGANQQKPRELACGNSGIWTHIGNGDDVAEELVAYTDFLRFATIDATVRWTSPYLDSFGLGYTVTAARTVTTSAGGSAASVAVVGIVAADLPLSSVVGVDAATNASLVEEVERYLAARSATARCPTGVVTECKLEQLRTRNNGQCLTGTMAEACARENSDVANTTVNCPAESLLSGGINGAFCTPLSPTTRIPAEPRHAISRDLQCCSRPTDRDVAVTSASVTGSSGTCPAFVNTSSGSSPVASPAASAALEAFDLDAGCDRIAECERTACGCLNPLATYNASGRTVFDRCPPAASPAMLMNASAACTRTAGCVSELAACVRTLWNSYNVNPSGVSSRCASWGSRVKVELVAARANATTDAQVAAAAASVRSLCEQSFVPWSCIHRVLSANNSAARRHRGGSFFARRQGAAAACNITSCDVGCDAFQLPAPAPTPAPPGPLGPGGISFGNTAAASSHDVAVALSLAVAVAMAFMLV
eukprot:CAMPEP_0174837336 /NCGR_PEP_ID=MMETSP1114-20130205/6666_1 /TAXON_ID=312471 /ORGANISM="Neobodo designis, Strain CCAP 1951/1" /LENGTH=814 /DNA_ID=CAMNT_0016071391 /DNA_START=287 /DNA_END=2731 /DNA_ORIENTATION=-